MTDKKSVSAVITVQSNVIFSGIDSIIALYVVSTPLSFLMNVPMTGEVHDPASI